MPDPSGRTGLGAAPGPHPGSATARLWLGGVGGGPSCSLGLLPQGVWTGRQGPQPGECAVITPPTGSGPRDGKCTSQGRPAESAAEPRMGGRRDCWAGGGAGLGAGPSPTCPLSLRSPLKLFQKDVEVQALLGVQESDLEDTQPGVWHPEEARSPAPVGAPSPGPAPPPWAPSWRGQLRAPWASPRGRRRAARCWRSPAPPPRGPGRSATPTWSCALRVRASGSCRPWGLRGRWPGGGSPLAASKQFVPAWITRGPG